MRKDLPPVRKTTTGKQVRGDVKLYDGKPESIYVDDRVSGEYHFVVPSTEFIITKDELYDVISKIEAQS